MEAEVQTEKETPFSDVHIKRETVSPSEELPSPCSLDVHGLPEMLMTLENNVSQYNTQEDKSYRSSTTLQSKRITRLERQRCTCLCPSRWSLDVPFSLVHVIQCASQPTESVLLKISLMVDNLLWLLEPDSFQVGEDTSFISLIGVAIWTTLISWTKPIKTC